MARQDVFRLGARSLLLTVAASALCAYGSGASAQETKEAPVTPSGPAQTPTTQLSEVIVTAQKRSENLQKTPLAITALSGQTLHDQQVTNPNDLTRVVPDVLVNSGGAAGDSGQSTTVFSIRGLGASGQGPLGSPAVAVHEDGHYFQTGLAANQFFDLDRVEVSPGPQGTLYGRSASAGAVNVITAKPKDHFEAAAEVEGGDYGDFRGFTMINVPLGDTLAVRISGQYQKHDGYLTNGYDDLNSGAVRAQALWKPISGLSVRLAAEYLHNGGLGTSPVFVGPEVAALGLSGSLYTRSLAQLGAVNGVVQPIKSDVDDTKARVFGEIAYNFGPAIFTVAPTYEEFQNKNTNNPIGQPYGYLSVSGPATQRGVEARFNDPGTTKLKWVVGFNYFDYSIIALIDEFVPPAPLTQLQVGPFKGIELVNAFDKIDEGKQTSKAVFGQFTYPILPHLRVTAGARQNWDDETYNGHLGTEGVFIGGSPNLIGPNPIVTPPLSSAVSFSKFTYKVALDYDLAPASLIYGTLGTGYKPGGLNEGGPASSNVPPTPLAPSQVFDPETVMHYEVGSKNRFLHNRLQINDAVYYDSYKNYQNLNNQPVNPLAVGAIGAVVTNAGQAKVYGNELSAEFQATSQDRFSAALNYLHATFTSYVVPAYLGEGGGPVPEQNYSGYRLPNAPQWSGTMSYAHRFDLTGGSSVTGLASTYISDFYYAYFQEQQGTEQKPYTKTLVSLTYQNAGHDFSVSGFVKNIENNATLISGSYTEPFTYVFLDAPRTYGFTVSKRF